MPKKSAPKKSVKKSEPLNIWMVGFVALIIVVAAVFATGFVQLKSQAVSSVNPSAAASNAIDYINKNLISGNVTATLAGEPSEVSGVYMFGLEVGGQQYESYVTKDGKLIFPTGIDMTKPVAATTG